MADKQHRMARASLMAALGITTFVPAAGATIMLTKDREPLVIQSEPGAAAALAQGEMPAVDISPQAVEAFFNAGYDYDHAVYLADYWGTATPYDAKVIKGKVLLGELDFPEAADSEQSEETYREFIDRALDAYFDAGYDYDHAEDLAISGDSIRLARPRCTRASS